jgi:fructose-specific phosphotransferase system IIB component
MNIVAVTACPTGIAHTYMAADRLEKAAKKLGHSIKVETHGAIGVENKLTKSEIAAASVAILATDIIIDEAERFDQIRKIKVRINAVMINPEGIFAEL